jgi:hypothetical protein
MQSTLDERGSQPGGAAAPPCHLMRHLAEPAPAQAVASFIFFLLNFPRFCRIVFPRLSSPIP